MGEDNVYFEHFANSEKPSAKHSDFFERMIEGKQSATVQNPWLEPFLSDRWHHADLSQRLSKFWREVKKSQPDHDEMKHCLIEVAVESMKFYQKNAGGASVDDEFTELVIGESQRAALLHGDLNSLHEAYAVLLEEVEEVWEEVVSVPINRESMATELIHVASATLRAYIMLEVPTVRLPKVITIGD